MLPSIPSERMPTSSSPDPAACLCLLDIHLPEGVDNPPLVMFIHGGGWRQGDRKKNKLDWLPAHGYAVASIEYRLSQEGVFPAQIHDCKGYVGPAACPCGPIRRGGGSVSEMDRALSIAQRSVERLRRRAAAPARHFRAAPASPLRWRSVQAHGWLDDGMRAAAVKCLAGLKPYLTPDGFLGGASQSNKGGPGLQRSDYRVIYQMGMGLMAQLIAALNGREDGARP